MERHGTRSIVDNKSVESGRPRRNRPVTAPPEPLLEQLEQRTLLAGVTVVTHGFQGDPENPANWLPNLRTAIAEYAGTRLQDIAEYAVRVTEAASGGLVVTGGTRLGPPLSSLSNSTGETVLMVDWSAVDALSLYSTSTVATAIAEKLLDTSFWTGLGLTARALTELPFHLIGHSRGGTLVSALARELGEHGIWVEQQTTLDARRLPGAGDQVPTVWTNTIFADNYFQTDDYPVSGEALDGATNRFLADLPDGYSFQEHDLFPSHSDVHLWYHGTVDTRTPTDDGFRLITSSMRNSWYTPNETRGQTAGYYYSRIGGGDRYPVLSGVSADFGGLGSRVPLVSDGPQWPNIADVRLPGGLVLRDGETVTTQFRYMDADSPTTIRLFADDDRNPYNGTGVSLTSLSRQPSAMVETGELAWTVDLPVRSEPYYIYAKITETQSGSPRTRYAYVNDPVFVSVAPTGADFATPLTSADLHWEASGTRGDGDPVPEGGERPLLRVRLRNIGGSTVTNVEGTLTCSNPDVSITDPAAYWDNILPGQSSLSVDRFDMSVANTSPIAVFTLHVAYNRGAVRYSQDVQFSQWFPRQGEVGAAFEVAGSSFSDPVIPGSTRNDGDGVFESGEDVDVLQLGLRNIGTAGATGLDVWLTLDDPADAARIEISGSGDIDGFTDAPVGGISYPALPGNGFSVESIDRSFAGTVYLDVNIAFDGGSFVIDRGLRLDVGPAPWFSRSPEEWNFGVVVPGATPSTTVTISNIGSGPMTVFGIDRIGTYGGMIQIENGAPFTLPPGQSRQVQLTLLTASLPDPTQFTGLNGSDPNRLYIQFAMDGRVRVEPLHRQVGITGLVSTRVPVYTIPGTLQPENPDIDGTTIVYTDPRDGDYDVYMYDIATGQDVNLTNDNPSYDTDARIDGRWVVWTATTGFNGPTDIRGYDRQAGTYFIVPSDPEHEQLVGVSGNYIAFRRRYGMTPLGHSLYNMWVYEIGGEVRLVTTFTSNDTVRDADFGDGLLVWEEETYLGGSSFGNPRVKIMRPGIDPSPVVVSGVTRLDPPENASVSNGGRFVFRRQDAADDYQVWLWENGTTRQITSFTRDAANDALGLGTDAIIYDYASMRPGLYWYDILSNVEHVLDSSLSNPRQLRMDERCAVWIDGGAPSVLRYACLRATPNPAISDIAVSPDQPIEGAAADFSVSLANTSDVGLASDITVRLYDGDPNAGGQLLGTQVLVGGLPPYGAGSVFFSNVGIPVGWEGQRAIYARLFVDGFDPPTDNTRSHTIVVRDSDTAGPLFSDVRVEEWAFEGADQPDGDGVVGSDEGIRISWLLADSSGVASTGYMNGGQFVPAEFSEGRYFVVLAPRSAGDSTIVLTASDDDVSPAASESSVPLHVVLAERLGVSHEGVAYFNNGTLDLGVFGYLSPPEEDALFLRNLGEQILRIDGLDAVPAGLLLVDGVPMSVAPDNPRVVVITPSTNTLGPNEVTVTIRTSDQTSPFVLTVRWQVGSPTAVYFDNDAGDFDLANPVNWTGDVLPGTADDVIISLPGHSLVTLGSGALAIGSLISDHPVVVTGGMFSVSGPAVFNADVSLTGGTLSLAAASTVTGTLSNSGTLILVSSAALAVTGDYTQTALGTLRTEVASASLFGRLTATGVAMLDGNLECTFAPSYAQVRGDSFDFVSAASRIGTFASASLPGTNGINTLRPTLLYTAGVARIFITSAADTNGDGVLNSQDFFDYLAFFFTSGGGADFNHDGIVNSQDFFDYLTVFFAG